MLHHQHLTFSYDYTILHDDLPWAVIFLYLVIFTGLDFNFIILLVL